MNSDYYDRLIRSSNKMLERWDGARAMIWSLTHSHRTLLVVLGDITSKDNMVVYCIEPLRMTGAFDWESSHLRVSLDSNTGEDPEIRLADDECQFEVRCAAIEVKENVSL